MASNASHGPRNLRIERQITLLEKDSKETNPTALAAKAYRKLSDESNFLQLMARYDTRFDRQHQRTLDRLDPPQKTKKSDFSLANQI
jgi:hypothetical protein